MSRLAPLLSRPAVLAGRLRHVPARAALVTESSCFPPPTRHRALRAQQATRLGVAVPGERIVLFGTLDVSGGNGLRPAAERRVGDGNTSRGRATTSTRGPARLRAFHAPPRWTSRPSAMRRSPPTSTAVKDVGSAADFIRKRRGRGENQPARLVVGTTIMAAYATRNTDRGQQTVPVCAAMDTHHALAPRDQRAAPAPTGSCSRMRRKRAGSPGAGDEESRADSSRCRSLAAATFSSDPWGVKQNPKNCARRTAPSRTRANMERRQGVLRARDDPRADPAAGGEWTERALHAQALFTKLVNRPTSSWCRSRGDAHLLRKRTACSVPRSAGVSRSAGRA